MTQNLHKSCGDVDHFFREQPRGHRRCSFPDQQGNVWYGYSRNVLPEIGDLVIVADIRPFKMIVNKTST
jgi:hypothetical protein